MAVAMLFGASRANADYSIGNATPGTLFFVQGQSFTPSVQGNAGIGTPSAPAGLVELTSFTIAFQDPTTAPSMLSIFDHAPTSADAASGSGSLGIGTYVGAGEYDFANPVILAFTSKYFAVLPTSASIFDGAGDPYSGGIDLFPRSAGGVVEEGFGDFDIGFTANLRAVPEPASLVMLGSGLIGMLCYSLRRRASVSASRA
jgi:hypothetical protein